MIERFMPLMAGVSCAGDGVPLGGELRDLQASSLARQTTRLAWQKDAGETPTRVFAYVDGELRGDVSAGEGALSISSLEAGDHSVQVLQGFERESPPGTFVDPYGQNALLFWEPSPSADCVGYNVYDSTDTPVLVGEVRDIVVAERIRVLPDTGTGDGRLTIWGAVPQGVTVNTTGTLEVMAFDPDTGELIADWTFGDDDPVSVSMVKGSVVNLSNGVTVAVHDTLASYQLGDTWTVHVGPKCRFVSATLDPGETWFMVKPVDAAGNEGIGSAPVKVFVMTVPDPVSGVALSFVGDILTVAYMLPAGADGVHVYCNHNPHTGLFEDWLVDNGLPYATIAGPAAEWVFDAAGVEGVLKFNLRTYNSECERLDEGLYSCSFPPTAADLGVILKEPTGLKATPTAGGTWKLEWDYRKAIGDGVVDGATEFHIYRTAGGGAIDYSAAPEAVVSMSAGAGRPARHFAYNWTGAPEAGDVRLAVRASNGTLEDSGTASVVVTVDAVAPAPVGGSGSAWGGPA